MNLSQQMRKLFTGEIGFALERMRATDNPAEKLYFFSAVYAAANRIFNIEFDPELVFVHNVVQNAHSQINAALTALSQGQGPAVGIPSALFVGLEEALEELMTQVRANKSTHEVLQRISNLTYSTTGNGLYLHAKGKLTL